LDTGNAGSGSSAGACTIGEILLTAGRTAEGFPARGQLLPISQYEVLFSLIGTTYGGDGQETFGLPDLRSITPNDMTYSICYQGYYPLHD
jgi:microcystin-dependent protein